MLLGDFNNVMAGNMVICDRPFKVSNSSRRRCQPPVGSVDVGALTRVPDVPTESGESIPNLISAPCVS